MPVVLLLLGFPIFMVLLTAVTVALVFFMHVPLAVLHQNLFGSVNATPLLAVPFFIYAGELMGRGSVAQRLVDFVQGGVGSVRGSLGVTTVGTSAIFGAISGASAATVATIGKVMVPAMRRAGYPETFTAGLITVGRRNRRHHPAEHSDDRLWRGGRGIRRAALCGRRHSRPDDRRHDRGLCHLARASARTSARASRSIASAFSTRLAAASGRWARRSSSWAESTAACFRRPRRRLSPASMRRSSPRFVFRELGWRDIIEAAAATVMFTGQILIIVACAGVFAWLLTVNQVPAAIAAWLQVVECLGLDASARASTFCCSLVGCFLDPLSAILLLSPLLVPMVKAVGIDTVHFGIVVTVNLAIGLFHPPFGINIFVAQSVLGLKLETIYRGIIPFVIIYLIALALITYIPEISLIGVRTLLAKP